MSHRTTILWIVGAVILLAGFGVALYFGAQTGTFVLFGSSDRATQQISSQSATIGTCWAFTSYSQQTESNATLNACRANSKWVGWWPLNKRFSSFGTYNPTPQNFNWNDTAGVCFVGTSNQQISTNLLSCITQYKTPPTQWQGHIIGAEGEVITNPDLPGADIGTPKKPAVQSADTTNGFCEGDTAGGHFVVRNGRSACDTLAAQYAADNDVQTNVTSWCPVLDQPSLCKRY